MSLSKENKIDSDCELSKEEQKNLKSDYEEDQTFNDEMKDEVEQVEWLQNKAQKLVSIKGRFRFT